MGSDPPGDSSHRLRFWPWRGHRIAWRREGNQGTPSAAVLLHGFGASLEHWRHNIPVISREMEVFALDLLGFGASDKPRSRLPGESGPEDSVRYCFDLWAHQVIDFLREQVPGFHNGRSIHLIGNSIGGLVALNTARLLRDQGEPVPAQVVLIDCAQRALDEKRILELTPLQRASRPLLKHLVRQRWVLAPLFRVLARRASIRMVLRQAYPSGANVDEELVELLRRPAMDPGALESFRGFVNLFEDHLAPELLADLEVPVRMIWGEADPWEDPAEARRWQRRFPCILELQVLEGLGHCPHDEDPERVNAILLRWLVPQTVVVQGPPDPLQ